MFTEDQVQRYSRHIILPNIGGKGQRKLLDSSVLVIGAGGLGSPIAMYLAAAGVGTLGIVDFDTVDVTNLQRQILHTTPTSAVPRSSPPWSICVRSTPRSTSSGTTRCCSRRTSWTSWRLRRRDRRHRQLPGAVPRERRHAVPREAARLRLDLPVRGAGHRVHAGQGDAVLPVPVPRRRRRRARSRPVPRAASSACSPA